MSAKTRTTAVVLIPPHEVWEPIQAIRRKHDPQVRRWMPHVTLLYPFRPREEFNRVAEPLRAAASVFHSFEVCLREFRAFRCASGRATLYLAPEPSGAITALQSALQKVVPDCNDVRLYPTGFTPHLSIGRAENREAADRLLRSLQTTWQPVQFVADRVSLIARDEPPNDVFEVILELPLGNG